MVWMSIRSPILFFIASLIVAAYSSISEEDKNEWENYKILLKKNYKTEKEDSERFNKYLKTKQIIEEHNKNFTNGLVSFEMGINAFSDMSLDELIQPVRGYCSKGFDTLKEGKQFERTDFTEDPHEIDWRKKGAVTKVSFCLPCFGGFWAFSGKGALEGQNFIKHGKLIPLSAQNILDCQKSGCGCCGGAYPWEAYTLAYNGVATESSYPFEAKNDFCRFNGSIGVTATGFAKIKPWDEKLLKHVVATVGPISVVVQAKEKFVTYKTGVLFDPTCDNKYFNFPALIVGYGTEDGKDYWLVKTALGLRYGENGYVKMARNRNNNCGISAHPTYPLV